MLVNQRRPRRRGAAAAGRCLPAFGQEEPWSIIATMVREWVRTQLEDGSISLTEVQRQRDAAGV